MMVGFMFRNWAQGGFLLSALLEDCASDLVNQFRLSDTFIG